MPEDSLESQFQQIDNMDFENMNFRADPSESMRVDMDDYSVIMEEKLKRKQS